MIERGEQEQEIEEKVKPKKKLNFFKNSKGEDNGKTVDQIFQEEYAKRGKSADDATVPTRLALEMASHGYYQGQYDMYMSIKGTIEALLASGKYDDMTQADRESVNRPMFVMKSYVGMTYKAMQSRGIDMSGMPVVE